MDRFSFASVVRRFVASCSSGSANAMSDAGALVTGGPMVQRLMAWLLIRLLHDLEQELKGPLPLSERGQGKLALIVTTALIFDELSTTFWSALTAVNSTDLDNQSRPRMPTATEGRLLQHIEVFMGELQNLLAGQEEEQLPLAQGEISISAEHILGGVRITASGEMGDGSSHWGVQLRKSADGPLFCIVEIRSPTDGPRDLNTSLWRHVSETFMGRFGDTVNVATDSGIQEVRIVQMEESYHQAS